MFRATVSWSLESVRKQSLEGKDERWCESSVAWAKRTEAG